MTEMQSSEERDAALARSTREKIRRAAREITRGKGDNLDRLVAAWPYLRPLFPKAVPGQSSLTDAQRLELQVYCAGNDFRIHGALGAPPRVLSMSAKPSRV
jgi:hypothetical protein